MLLDRVALIRHTSNILKVSMLCQEVTCCVSMHLYMVPEGHGQHQDRVSLVTGKACETLSLAQLQQWRTCTLWCFVPDLDTDGTAKECFLVGLVGITTVDIVHSCLNTY